MEALFSHGTPATGLPASYRGKHSLSDGSPSLRPAKGKLSLRLPDGAPSPGSAKGKLLRESVREFLVCRALHGWLSATLPEAAPPWHTRADEMLTRISTLARRSALPFTRRQSPF